MPPLQKVSSIGLLLRRCITEFHHEEVQPLRGVILSGTNFFVSIFCSGKINDSFLHLLMLQKQERETDMRTR